VNTRELGRVPGRKKTDRVDCKWIQRLHSRVQEKDSGSRKLPCF
jgi:hypothetical protein